jgi:hypothetical protein
MTTATRTLPPVLGLVALYATLLGIFRSQIFAANPELIAACIAIDLTLTASGLVWFLGVRRAGWPRWTIGMTFGLGIFLGRTVLPAGTVLSAIMAVWITLEIALIVLAIGKLRTIVSAARRHDGPGPIDALAAGLVAAKVPPRVAAIIATDATVMWLGVTGWFRRRAKTGFSLYRRGGWTAVIFVLLKLVAVETILVHMLIATQSVVAAWIVTGLSIYSGLWLAADLHVLRLYPLRVTADAIVAAVGIRWRITIPRDAIASITPVTSVPDGAFNASVMEPTLVVTLSRPIEIRGLFGIRRTASAIALSVDEPERFLSALPSRCEPEPSPPAAAR